VSGKSVHAAFDYGQLTVDAGILSRTVMEPLFGIAVSSSLYGPKRAGMHLA